MPADRDNQSSNPPRATRGSRGLYNAAGAGLLATAAVVGHRFLPSDEPPPRNSDDAPISRTWQEKIHRRVQLNAQRLAETTVNVEGKVIQCPVEALELFIEDPAVRLSPKQVAERLGNKDYDAANPHSPIFWVAEYELTERSKQEIAAYHSSDNEGVGSFRAPWPKFKKNILSISEATLRANPPHPIIDALGEYTRGEQPLEGTNGYVVVTENSKVIADPQVIYMPLGSMPKIPLAQETQYTPGAAR